MRILKYTVRTRESDLADLQRRIRATRWPDQIPGSGWDYGTDSAYLRDLCDYWETSFDWASVEAAVNAWPNFVTETQGQRLHFLHARSTRADAVPILLLHGWPGSVLEFLKVLPLLVEGDAATAAFHVVVPSMPGFGWSGPTTTPGWSPARIAGAYAGLMAALGYESYFVQGGDYGAAVGLQLARQFPENVQGVHLNIVPTAGHQPEDGQPTAEESRFIADTAAYRASEEGYIAIQRTKPQTLAYALTDSPVGLAAWIVEKYHRWTDCDGVIENAISRDDLLAGITLYWLTETSGSSGRLYYESARPGEGIPAGYIDVPVGCAIFPRELYPASRRWAERHYNIVRWTEMPRGGHFPAVEQPELLAADIAAFVATMEE